jgi:hypothetical protein
MALKVVSTGDKNSLLRAIETLEEAHHKMRMAEIDNFLATDKANLCPEKK